MRLSYTSLNNLHNGHEWVNKMLGIPVPDYPFLTEGKKAHRIIQDHVSGREHHEALKHIEIQFPIVEIVNFDKRCEFHHNVEGYDIFGYVDGVDVKKKRFLEIKTSSVPWSMGKFQKAMQRKLYGLALLDYEESILITGSKNPEEWKDNPPKLYSVPVTQKDKDEALEWIKKGIEILESGKFAGGLDENKKCQGCFWNMRQYPQLANCHFI